MHRRLGAVLLAAAALLAGPAGVIADGPTNGNILVPVDHVLPGEQFRITGFDIDPGITLSVRLVSGQRSAELGEISVAPDGTVEATGIVPNDFPLGYAELHAVSEGEGSWSTVVLIGPRAEGPGNVNAVGDASEQQVALAVLGFGLVIFVIAGIAFVRAGRAERRKPTERG